MAVNTAPIFTNGGVVDQGQVSVANTARDGTGTVVQLSAGTVEGKRINAIRAKATVTTTAGMVRIFFSPDGGTTKRLIGEINIAALTVSASQQAAEGDWIPPGGFLILLTTNAILYVSTHNAEAINVFALGGTYAA
ncbi:MAG: hypothetical protein L0338_39720 [Acidobacteria bacterium]|nr:hypothetical protein [Acidobacteriota bacterium]